MGALDAWTKFKGTKGSMLFTTVATNAVSNPTWRAATEANTMKAAVVKATVKPVVKAAVKPVVKAAVAPVAPVKKNRRLQAPVAPVKPVVPVVAAKKVFTQDSNGLTVTDNDVFKSDFPVVTLLVPGETQVLMEAANLLKVCVLAVFALLMLN